MLEFSIAYFQSSDDKGQGAMESKTRQKNI